MSAWRPPPTRQQKITSVGLHWHWWSSASRPPPARQQKMTSVGLHRHWWNSARRPPPSRQHKFSRIGQAELGGAPLYIHQWKCSAEFHSNSDRRPLVESGAVLSGLYLHQLQCTPKAEISTLDKKLKSYVSECHGDTYSSFNVTLVTGMHPFVSLY